MVVLTFFLFIQITYNKYWLEKFSLKGSLHFIELMKIDEKKNGQRLLQNISNIYLTYKILRGLSKLYITFEGQM